MRFFRHLCAGLVVASMAAWSVPAWGQHQHGGHVDVRPYLSGGQIRIGAAELDGAEVEPISDDHRVFGSELGEEQPLFSDHPGFLAEPGAFPGGAGQWLAFDATAGLGFWNGAGFGAAPAGESLTILLGSQEVNVSTGPVAGFPFALIDLAGGIHQHVEFYLLGSDGNPDPDDGIAPTLGIYLLELSLRTTIEGVAASDPFWIVFNNGDTEENHELAVEWAEEHLVPEPAVGLMTAGLGMSLLRRRRRS